MKKSYTSSLDNLHDVLHDVEVFCATNKVDEDVTYAFTLCIDELFTNIITYGYNQDPNYCVELELFLENAMMTAKISDTCTPFNPITQARSPDLTSGLQERDVGGLGVYFTKKTMDVFEYGRIDGANVLTLKKRLGTELKAK